MIIFQIFKKIYRDIKKFVKPHPLFSILDHHRLSKINKDTKGKGFLSLKPKGWLHSIKIRRNYTDKEVVYYVLQDQYHLPPDVSKIPTAPVILDLGSNIGLTIVHMKQVYPNAKIIGYEMNKENYLLAKHNTKFYMDTLVVNKAVWIENSKVTYKTSSNFDAYSIVNDNISNESNDLVEVDSININSILKNHELSHVDYLKMDIEGAEIAILESHDLGWMDSVNSMNIEMHLDPDNDLKKFIEIIEKKGFLVWKDTKHWSSIFAVRKNL
ncbi:FkbM family methyltransferase [Flavobacterium algicola]|uniref:FkbM family methyltransferase n=1 Tax=Flavobacterium algicola TaxID=556529 RepID=UPI001EFD5C59|nr:FkbM family methyltransferase [Flavobacterium algicola]MCG9793896.1 FkbM family methyltransferase [Flavobacterium algicola]